MKLVITTTHNRVEWTTAGCWHCGQPQSDANKGEEGMQTHNACVSDVAETIELE